LLRSSICEFGARLLEVRREMAWNRLGLNEEFHTTKNSQAFRDYIFEALREASFVVLAPPRCAAPSGHWSASSHLCLHAAGYVGWAIQRKWEMGDCRPYDIIAHKVRSEEDEFRASTETV
jgi:hypothetical protein